VNASAPAAPPGSVELRSGTTSVTIVPALGGKIISLHTAGREWLWRNATQPPRALPAGAAYGDTGNGGGFDECFPTIAPCTLPSGTTGYGGLTLPDHGELWSRPATFTLETRTDGVHATTEWRGERMPYRFVRTVLARNDGVEMRYRVANEGAHRLPFIWCAHPLFPLTKHTRLVVADGTRMRLWSQRDIELGAPGTELRWPRAVVGGKFVDLSQPHLVARSFACKLFLEPSMGQAAIEENGARLDVTFDTTRVPFLGVWIDKGAWSLFRRGGAVRTVAIEPGIGAPDSLAEAMGAWRSAAWLEAGETREWSVGWRGTSNGGSGE
jgi:galactose mutarotase-like enzyme